MNIRDNTFAIAAADVQISNISRRKMLKGFALGGFVLAVGLPLRARAEGEEQKGPKKYGADAMPHGTVDNPLIFVAIAADGAITILCHRAEMGQGVRTSLPMVVADEMEADWGRVTVKQAWAEEARFGNQDTDGSRSVRHFFMPMRRVGAAARAMLVSAAASQWNVPESEVQAKNHELIHTPTGKKLGFGDVAQKAAQLEVPSGDALKLKSADAFRYIGKGQTHIADGMDIVTGRAQYGQDVRLEGMLYAVVARPPVFGGKLVKVDDAAALKIPGVVKVVTLAGSPPPAMFNPLGGVAVIATNTWAAIAGRKALKIEWEGGPHASYDSAEYRKQLEASVRKPTEKAVRNDGDAMAALGSAAKRIQAEYYVPHLAQAPMETPVATVRIVDGKCEAWASVQAPQATHDMLVKWLELPPENVKVNQTLLGGGFGRKSKPDFVVEAGLLSKAMDGKPVKVTWTREDDIQHSYYHTVSVEHLEAGLDAQGKVTAWLHRTAAPSIGSTFADTKLQSAGELGMGAANVPFAIPNVRVENPEAEAHTRIGWFRSVSNIPRAFAIQSFVAEMAAELDKDHRDFLLDLIGPARRINPADLSDSWNHDESPEKYPVDTGRLRNVIEVVTREAGWGKSGAKGQAMGLAAHYSFVTYVATVVHVEVSDNGELSIPRVDVAVDCGPQVNPERIRSQIEGATVMGVSLATMGEISFKNGAAVQSNFHDYRITSMMSAPREIHVHLVAASDYDAPLGGVGEPGTPPVSAALCNAIFAATGKRIRSLPIGNQMQQKS